LNNSKGPYRPFAFTRPTPPDFRAFTQPLTLLAQMPFHRILLIGNSHDHTLPALADCPVEVLASVDDALAVLGRLCRAGDLLFIKGSNANNLVQIAPALARFSR